MGSTGSLSDWFSGTAAVTTGLGILTFALAPFAIPIVLLTAVAALPLVLPLVAFAALAAAGRGIRRLGRGFGRRGERVNRAPAVWRADPCHD
jgi:hypothetical protein